MRAFTRIISVCHCDIIATGSVASISAASRPTPASSSRASGCWSCCSGSSGSPTPWCRTLWACCAARAPSTTGPLTLSMIARGRTGVPHATFFASNELSPQTVQSDLLRNRSIGLLHGWGPLAAAAPGLQAARRPSILAPGCSSGQGFWISISALQRNPANEACPRAAGCLVRSSTRRRWRCCWLRLSSSSPCSASTCR